MPGRDREIMTKGGMRKKELRSNLKSTKAAEREGEYEKVHRVGRD